MFVTRQDYDRLILDSGEWMTEVWPTLYRRWSLGGVFVRGPEYHMEALALLLGGNPIAVAYYPAR